MQHAGARTLWEDDHDYDRTAGGRRLRVVGDADRLDGPVDDVQSRVSADDARPTVRITGHPLPARRRRSPTHSQIEARPDRIALWAVLLGLFLVFMAVATANAAT